MPLYYDANVQAGDLILFDWSTGVDQYGNLVGLGDDTRWTVREVRAQCAEKIDEDTIFWPADAKLNERVWFPGWTAPLDEINGLPYPPYPLVGYPYSPCLDRHEFLPDMPSQVATVEVSARAVWIEVELMLEPGDYTVLWPGEMIAEPITGTTTHEISEPGEIIVTQGGQAQTFIVSEAWFWIKAEFDVNVGPTGVC